MPLFRLFGVSIFSLRLGIILLFTLFLVCFYLVTRLLYSKGLALVSLFVVSIGANSTFLPEMMAGGGVMETLICGASLLLLATLLALSAPPRAGGQPPDAQPLNSVSPPLILHDREPRKLPWLQHKRWRLFTFALWACIAGLGLWSHLLVVPFLLVSAMLLILFCRQELRATSSKLSLLAGFIVGGFPLIVYNVLNPLQNSLLVFLQNNHAVDALAPTGISLYVKEAVGTFLYGLPIMTGFSPTCPAQQLPPYGPWTYAALSCSLAQGAWSLGYLALLVAAGVSAWRP